MNYLLPVIILVFLVSPIISVDPVFGFAPPVDQSNWGKGCLIDNDLFVILSGSTSSLFKYTRAEGGETIEYDENLWNSEPIRDLYCTDTTIIMLDDSAVYLLDTELEELDSYEIDSENGTMAISNSFILIRDHQQLIIFSFDIEDENITLVAQFDSSTFDWLNNVELPSICCGSDICWVNDNYNLYQYNFTLSEWVNATLEQGYHVGLVCQDDFLWIAYNFTAENNSATWISYTTLIIDQNSYQNFAKEQEIKYRDSMTKYTSLFGTYYNPVILYEFGVMLWPNPSGILVTQLFPDTVYNKQNQIWKTDDTPLYLLYLGSDSTEVEQNTNSLVLDRNDFIIVIAHDSIIGYLASEFELEYVRRLDNLILLQDQNLGITIITIMGTGYLFSWSSLLLDLFVFHYLHSVWQ